MALVVSTPLGQIRLALRPDAAPATVAHITKLVRDKIFDGTVWYRSDFVIQTGLHGSGRPNPHADLAVNESVGAGAAGALSNTRGAAAVAHWDAPDCGNSEWFISLRDNPHLDAAYGGYAVFAAVRAASRSLHCVLAH